MSSSSSPLFLKSNYCFLDFLTFFSFMISIKLKRLILPIDLIIPIVLLSKFPLPHATFYSLEVHGKINGIVNCGMSYFLFQSPEFE